MILIYSIILFVILAKLIDNKLDKFNKKRIINNDYKFCMLLTTVAIFCYFVVYSIMKD